MTSTVGATAVEQDIAIEQDSTFQLVFDVTGVADLTGWTAKFQIRATADATTALVDKNATVDPAENTVTVTLDRTDTAGLTFQAAEYGLALFDSGGTIKKPLAAGKAYLTPSIVR